MNRKRVQYTEQRKTQSHHNESQGALIQKNSTICASKKEKCPVFNYEQINYCDSFPILHNDMKKEIQTSEKAGVHKGTNAFGRKLAAGQF